MTGERKIETFQKKLLRLGRGNLLVPILFLAVAVITAVVIAAASNFEAKDADDAPFDGTSGGYAQAEVIYLMGPFASQSIDGKISDEYYLAEDTEGYFIVVDTGRSTDLPVYGEDVTTDAEIAALPARTLQGNGTAIPEELAYYLIDYFSDTDIDITADNYSEFFGDYYLDTTDTGGNDWLSYLFSGIMGFLGLILLLTEGSRGRNIKKKLKSLDETGELYRISEDFASETAEFSRKLKVAVSPHYLLDMTAPQGGFQVISLAGMTNAFKCNMIGGEPTATSYIALETADGKRTCVAPCNGKTKELDKVLAGLKTKIAQGGAEI